MGPISSRCVAPPDFHPYWLFTIQRMPYSKVKYSEVL